MALTPTQVYGALKSQIDSLATGFDRADANADGSITIYFNDGSSVKTQPIKGDQGPTGPKGDDGVSPTVSMEELPDGKVKITITDATGDHSATVASYDDTALVKRVKKIEDDVEIFEFTLEDGTVVTKNIRILPAN